MSRYKGYSIKSKSTLPALFLWIILTERESEDVWLRSLVKQMGMYENWMAWLAEMISPANRHFRWLMKLAGKLFAILYIETIHS